MPIYIDDVESQVDAPSLAQALTLVTQQLDAAGRVVVEVQLDGQSLSAEQIGEQGDEPLDSSRLELYTADPRELAVTTLAQIRDVLGDAGQMQTQAAELLQKDEAPQAMKLVSESLEIWRHTGQAVLQSAQLLGLQLDSYEFEGEPVSSATDDLLTKLRELSELVVAGDTVSLADMLAYEWPDITARWERLVAQLIEWIDAPSSPA